MKIGLFLIFDHIWHFRIFARHGARESPIMLKLVSKFSFFFKIYKNL